VIARGMSKRPIDRYPDVLSFADALREAVGVIAVDRRRVPRLTSSRALPQLGPMAEVVAPVVEPPGRQSKGDGMPLMRRSESRSVVLVLAAAAALAWFSPGTRTAAPAAWYHGGAKAQAVVSTTTDPGHELQRSAEVPRL